MDLITVNELCNTIVKVAKTVDEKRRKTPGTMNIAEIMNRHHLENQHSNILSFLIDPDEKHNHTEYGESFLFLLKEKGLKIKGSKIFSVTREDSTDEYRRMDLLIETDTDFIIIENKIDAGDQQNQISDYVSFLELKTNVPDKIFIVYLTLFGDQPSKKSISIEMLNELKKSNRFISLSYSDDIISWLEKLQVSKEEVILQSGINQYIDVVKGITHKRKEIFNMKQEVSKELLKEFGDLSREQLKEKMLAMYKFQQNINLTLFINFFKDLYEEANGKLTLFCNDNYDYKDFDTWKNDVANTQQKFGVRFLENNVTLDLFIYDLDSNKFVFACKEEEICGYGNNVDIDGYASAQEINSWFVNAILFCNDWEKKAKTKLSTHVVKNWFEIKLHGVNK